MTVGPKPIASVIIPAHNEESVLARCLDALLDGSAPGELDVIVAANGCNDRTPEIAETYAERGVRLVTIGEASKSAALNLGDQAALTHPRVYLDADVVVTRDAVIAMCRAMAEPEGPRAVAPRLRVDSRHSTWSARAYLAVWQSLPVFAQSYLGSGCYALSRDGRRDFDRFPDVVGDDKFVNDLFLDSQKQTIQGHDTLIFAPTTLRGIVRRSVRVQEGTRALVEADDKSAVRQRESIASTRAHVLRLGHRPRNWSGIVLFVSVQVWVRLAASRRVKSGKDGTWLRDETSRTSTPGSMNPNGDGAAPR